LANAKRTQKLFFATVKAAYLNAVVYPWHALHGSGKP
jgi:hypothetical protein